MLDRNRILFVTAVLAGMLCAGLLTACSSGSSGSSQNADSSAGVSSAMQSSLVEGESELQGEEYEEDWDGSVKGSVDEYSWKALSAISAEISSAGDEASALEIAKKYGLCNEDGIPDNTHIKNVDLGDGSVARAQIIGFYYDDKSDGSGKAGITFQFFDCVDSQAMSYSSTNSGGWEASEMRRWLNADFLESLPSSLRSAIVEVDKRTNNVGETSSTSSVTTTKDSIWLLSVTELQGYTSAAVTSDGNDVLNEERAEHQNQYSEYQFFAKNSGDVALARMKDGSKKSWLLRSPTPDESAFYYAINSKNNELAICEADDSAGVAPCFCI